MQFIPLKNPRLTKLLQNITDVLYQEKYVKLIAKTRDRKDSMQPQNYGCSDEYLHEAFKHRVTAYGFPQSCLGMGMKEYEPALLEVTKPIHNTIDRISNFIGSPTNALTMAYPDNGYIGWHHNGNAPGYNILMTYSQDGDGCFKYWDSVDKKIITHPDPVGWSVKVGYYPNERTETERVYWHCAETKKQRISVAWVINHREMWKDMINTISDGTYDPVVLEQKHMKF